VTWHSVEEHALDTVHHLFEREVLSVRSHPRIMPDQR
jgi:hypothetical protein